MAKGWRRIGTALLVSCVVVLVATAAIAAQNIRSSWPQTTGTIELAILEHPVEVLRDGDDIPHLYGRTASDLFAAQGYIHAQERFWQMDVWRHIGSGRLAEMFGASQIATDRFLRTLGWARVAAQEWEQIDAETQANLTAYAAGVNAYLATHQGSTLSLEYPILKLLNPAYRPEPWQPLHSLTWGKIMAWDLGSNMEDEIERAVLLQHLSPEQVEDLFPPYPADRPTIISQSDRSQSDRSQPDRLQPAKPTRETARGIENPNSLAIPQLASLDPSLAKAFNQLQAPLEALQSLVGAEGRGIGSNNWVLSGQHTETGLPLLANDPHLAVQLPSIWFQMGLHCQLPNRTCPYDVEGFSFPGNAGVIIGHNARVAWGVTNVGPDVMDLYVEKINPANPNQYEVNGKWVEMEIVPETIQVAGGEAIEQTVRYTRHGPIILETYGELEPLRDRAPGDPAPQFDWPERYAIALRWTALEPSALISSIFQLDRAQNWQDFRSAVQLFGVPAQNFVYGDVDGNIGYQMSGRIPLRRSGDGRYPVPGWTDEFEWQGYLDFADLPQAFNPASGYIVTANNAVTDGEIAALISRDWDYGYRAQRIVEAIETRDRALSLDDMAAMQSDNRNLNAETLIPYLKALEWSDPQLNELRQMLAEWDYQQPMKGSAPALFEAFWQQLLAATFHDDLPKEYWPGGGDRWAEIVRQLLPDPENAWWDNQATPDVEDRDRILTQAFTQAVALLDDTLGSNRDRWQWGDLHQMTFRNQTLGKSGNPLAESLFNRGPFPVSGSNAIVNATAWNAARSFEVTWFPSMRMVVDLSNLNHSRALHAPGQSGHAFHPHYADLVEPWQQGTLHPMLCDRAAIEQQATQRLVLTPLEAGTQ